MKGELGESLFKRNAHRWEPVTETIEEHLREQYDQYIPTEASIHFQEDHDTETRGQIENALDESIVGTFDFIFSAKWNLKNIDKNPYEKYSEFGKDKLDHPPITKIRSGRGTLIQAKIVYPIEIKSFSGDTNLRLSPKQEEMFPMIVEKIKYVHPILIKINLDSLPRAVDLNIELFSKSRWYSK
jgi:hypothetical protein